MKITTLIENLPGDEPALHGEHGLSFYVETKEGNVLFDTGQTEKFLDNARELDIDLDETNVVVLSHGHYDHTGGFSSFVKTGHKNFDLCVGPGFLNEKYGYDGMEYRYMGNQFDRGFLKNNHISVRCVEDKPLEILPNVYVITHFDTNIHYEKTNMRFLVKDGDEYSVDSFGDEVVVVLDSSKGLVVLVGCAHVGIVNILEHVNRAFDKPIYGIMGGTHLVEADEKRLQNTIGYLQEANVQLLGLSHCTGKKACDRLQEVFGDRYFYNRTGTSVSV